MIENKEYYEFILVQNRKVAEMIEKRLKALHNESWLAMTIIPDGAFDEDLDVIKEHNHIMWEVLRRLS